MQRFCFSHLRQTTSKWLFMLFLFVNFFTFSGAVSGLKERQRSITQTEVVLSIQHRHSNKIVSYYKTPLVKKLIANLPIPYSSGSLLNYNNLLKVRIKILNKTYFSPIYLHHCPTKTIPQSSEEDILNTTNIG